MKKIILSISLLCSIPVYAMEQLFYLKDLTQKVEEEKKRMKEYKQGAHQSSFDCASKIHELLKRYHSSPLKIASAGLDTLLATVRAYAREAYDHAQGDEEGGLCLEAIGEIDVADMDSLIALYEGMQQAVNIHEKVQQTQGYQGAVNMLQQPLPNFAAVEFIHSYMMEATKELEKDEVNKVCFENVRSALPLTEKNFLESTLIEWKMSPAIANAKIKKLTTYYMNMVFAEKAAIETISRVQ